MREPRKKRYPMSKDKGEATMRWLGDAIMIKIRSHTQWWATHKLEKYNTKEVPWLLWRFWAQHPASQPGESHRRTRNPQGIWLWRPAGFDYRMSTGLGKETPLSEGVNKIFCAPGRRETSGDRGRLSQSCLLVLEGLLWRSGLGVAQHRGRGTGSSSPGGALLAITINPTTEPVVSRAAAGQATNREGGQPHSSTDNWITVLLSMAQ